MIDAWGREINYMRVSITDRCNLRCRYCMPEDLPGIPHESILRYEEILRVCRIAGMLGIHRFRVTGGEPLARRGAARFLTSMRELEGVEFLGMTTNGALLMKELPELQAARLDSVNISLDTLSPGLYRELTGTDALFQVLGAICAALDMGIRVKLNCVLMRGINDGEVLALAKLAEERPVDVRFIELMPLGAGRGFSPVPGGEVLSELLSVYKDLAPVSSQGCGPARNYSSADLMGQIGFIDALSGHFCNQCNRVRLSSEGFLKLCLYHDHGVDLRALLRGGASDVEIQSVIEQAITQKPDGHHFGSTGDAELKGLSTIGG